MKKLSLIIPLLAALTSWDATAAEGPPDPQVLIAAQKTALSRLAMLDGQRRRIRARESFSSA